MYEPRRVSTALRYVPKPGDCSLSKTYKFIECQSDILCDLSQESWRNITPLMEGHGCVSPRAVTKLLVRPALPHLRESQFEQNRDDFRGLEDRNVSHDSCNGNVLNSNKLRFKLRITILKEHADNFLEIRV